MAKTQWKKHTWMPEAHYAQLEAARAKWEAGQMTDAAFGNAVNRITSAAAKAVIRASKGAR